MVVNSQSFGLNTYLNYNKQGALHLQNSNHFQK